jgi:hypothetical protein
VAYAVLFYIKIFSYVSITTKSVIKLCKACILHCVQISLNQVGKRGLYALLLNVFKYS